MEHSQFNIFGNDVLNSQLCPPRCRMFTRDGMKQLALDPAGYTHTSLDAIAMNAKSGCELCQLFEMANNQRSSLGPTITKQ